MRVIEVNSIPINEVIRDIANALNVSVKEDCNQLSLRLPRDLGKGEISGIQFNNGLGYIQYNAVLKTDLEIHFVVDKIHPLKFIYMVDGCLIHRFANEDCNHSVEKYQHTIVASRKNCGHIIQLNKSTKLSVMSIEVDRSEFMSNLTCKLKGMETELKQVFKDIKAENQFYHKGYFSLKITDLYHKINSFKKKDFIRKLYIEGITYQMLTHELVQYEDEARGAFDNKILTSYELDSIKKAANFIENKIHKKPEVSDIAREVGLNENKLQYGFQHLYGVSVNGYCQEVRLKMAKTLLQNTNLRISEIVDLIGLKSNSYFSRIFGERYELTPVQYRKKNSVG